MAKMDLSKFKKVSSDDLHTILRHKAGHEIKLNHKALDPKMLKDLGKLHMAKGGPVKQANPKLEESKKLPHYYDGADVGGPSDDQTDVMDAAINKPQSSQMPKDNLNISPVSQDAVEYEEVGAVPRTVEYEEAGVPPSAQEIAAMQKSSSPDMSAAKFEPLPQPPEQAAAAMKQPAASKEETPTPRGPLEQAQENIRIQDKMNKLAEDKNRIMAAQLKAQIDIQEQSTKKIEEISKRQDDQMMMMLNEIKDRKIEPGRLWSNMNVWQKTLAGLSLFLGGLASGAEGGPNVALDFLNKQIDRDIDAQSKDKTEKMNLYKINLQLLGDEKAAAMKTKMEKLNILALQTNQKLLQSNDQETKLRGAQIRDQLVQQAGQIKQGLVFKEFLTSEAQSDKLIHMHPATILDRFVTPANKESRKEALKEINDAEKANHLAKQAMRAFEELKEWYSSPVWNTIAAAGKTVGWEPPQVKIIRDILAQTVQKNVGTVREMPMEKAEEAYVPKGSDFLTGAGDIKIRDMMDYLGSSMQDANFRSITGLPLNKFYSTATPVSSAQSGEPMGMQKVVQKLYRDKGNPNDGRVGLFDQRTNKFIKWKD